MHDDLTELRRLKFMPSRIPALEAFVPGGTEPDAAFKALQDRTGQTRWYPVEGGHRVLILYEGGAFDPQQFKFIKGAWDHEHCSRCGATIPPMTLCWVTERGAYVLLDENCYKEAFGPEALS